MLRFRSLASSSAGNATLIEAASGTLRTRILIDCGLGVRQLRARLDQAGVAPEDLSAIFITHEHGDHVGCVLRFAPKYRIPVWTGEGTREQIGANGDTLTLFRTAADGVPIAIGALQITPFTVPHDAREPLQLTITDGARKFGILTDTGRATNHTLDALAQCHALMLEGNHDPELLARSRYPEFLQRRIASELGHLSNAQASDVLRHVNWAQLGIVVGAHLSERNNRPGLVRSTFADALGRSADEIQVSSREGLDWLPV